MRAPKTADIREYARVAEHHLREAVGQTKRAVGFSSCNSSSRTRALIRASHCHKMAAEHLGVACDALRRLADLV